MSNVRPIKKEGPDERQVQLVGELIGCPTCGGTYLHHTTVHVISRIAEDGPGVVASVESGKAMIRHFNGEHPSERRDSIKLAFQCESCSAPFYLKIIHHKGRTILKWIVGPFI